VGDGPLRKSLSSAFPDIHFLGYKEKSELLEIYRSCDVFVFPSITDTLGLVNIEALACGLPVIAYDIDGPNTIVKNGVNGILVSYGENLESALEKIKFIHKKDCIDSAKPYSWENYARIFLESQTLIPSSQWT